MSYFGAAILVLFLLALTSAGWYYLFKRFEARISSRFDDLVQRSEENLKSFSDVLEMLWTIIDKQGEHSVEFTDLAERIQNVKLEAERILHELEKADKKHDIAQGLALVLKQDRFLEHARSMGDTYLEKGEIDEEALEKLEKFINDMKLENYSKY